MLFLLLSIILLITLINGNVYFKEEFLDATSLDSWVQSSEWKSSSEMGKFVWGSGNWYGDKDINAGMITSTDAKFYGISKKLEKPFSNKDKDLVVQFSVKHEKKESSFCAGGYIKLLPSSTKQESFGGDAKYYIMFGPDLCGYDVSRIHVIFHHEGNNLLKTEDIKLEYADKNEFTHVYTLVVKPDNTYKVYLDLVEKASGKLHSDWAFPQKTIDDPTDSKPSDWVDEKQIPDPSDKKPEGYDDIPAQIVDPEATKPDDWDDEDDGKWEAPMIPNPAFKGPWVQKKIDNPAYKGEWKAKQISNPKYQENVYHYDDIGVVGFELWVVNGGSVYDNIFIGDSFDEAKQFAEATFSKTIEKEKEAKKLIDDKKKEEEEAASKAAAAESEKEEKSEKSAGEDDEKDEL